ncbi:twin-arginine translocation signal domain-containing protein [Halomarina rubra]|uniref:Twin-arginine translocation signal domain-containing protein n=1 Tax=Halomarina rubra TaxID=2071873 RepID=A0ABD6AU72_9EURY|nr:twin-arginine translocation signal domain-containing protein [Halomarina rubra]
MTTTRRGFLAGCGGVLAALAGCSSDSSTPQRGWVTVDSPTGAALADVVMTADGPVAVGEGGVVVHRADGADWAVVDEDGPADASNGLVAVAATDDGAHVWFVGSSGAIGRLRVATGDVKDYSAPAGRTSSWEAVTVVGAAGSERVYVANGSGELLVAQLRGTEPTWEGPSKPTGGNNAVAMDDADGVVFLASQNAVARRANGQWNRIDAPSASITDVSALSASVLNATTDAGTVVSYNGHNWLQAVQAENPLTAVDRVDDRGLAVGDSAVFILTGGQWRNDDGPDASLRGVALGTARFADVAVGSEGTIAERF